MSYAYWLCFHTDRWQWFRRKTLGLLVVTSIVVNGIDLLLWITLVLLQLIEVLYAGTVWPLITGIVTFGIFI